MAIAAEIKKLQPGTKIVFIGQRGDPLAKIVAENEYIDESHSIYAGKFRRYHGEGWRQILDIKTMLLNIRDGFYFAIGCLQMLRLLKQIQPESIFVKGGFVGVPVGLAAAFWKVPYITHDSDAIPGLANRIIARWATLHAVALPKENYAYPQSKTVTLGVPIAGEFEFITKTEQSKIKKELGIAKDSLVLLVTGGGLGAQSINKAITGGSLGLLREYPELTIVHLTGQKHYDSIESEYAKLPNNVRPRVIVKDFVTDMYKYSAAADIVVARAGATNMAEFAMQGKACIIVPNPVLTGGHQLKNAQAYANKKAVRIVSQDELDDDPGALLHQIHILINSPKDRALLGKQLHSFAYANSAVTLAQLLIEQAKEHKPRV